MGRRTDTRLRLRIVQKRRLRAIGGQYLCSKCCRPLATPDRGMNAVVHGENESGRRIALGDGRNDGMGRFHTLAPAAILFSRDETKQA
ncbi:hypothetical protein D3C78_1136920 [compost metagenome]